MHLPGWNDIPDGYGAHFEVAEAPVWLRVFYRTPFLDRFAYPLLVRRGLGVLTPHPGWVEADRAAVSGSWRISDATDAVAGSVSPLALKDQR